MKESFYVPYEAIGELTKFINKVKKNLPSIEANIGEKETKVFKHGTRDIEGFIGMTRMFHDVCKVDLSYPDENNFQLLAKIEDGMLFPMNFGKKVEFPEGKDENYCYCDVCGRRTFAFRYILKNTETNEVFFVGKECAKKFGVKTLGKIYDFTKKLHEFFDAYGCGIGDDEWMYGCQYKEDKRHEMMAMSPRIILASAYYYYSNISKVWEKGYYEGRTYYPSQSMEEIKSLIFKNEDNRPTIDDEMYDTLMSFGKKEYEGKSGEFNENIYKFTTDYYSRAADSCYAFFLVKSYFDSLKEKPSINVGDYIKITGKIAKRIWEKDYYGLSPICYIKHDSFDIRLIRKGVVKGDVGDEIVAYSIVKYISKNGDIYLDRVTTKPKKGIDYKTL